MSARTLKLIAIISMTIDHVGLYLVDQGSVWHMVLRSIGRIAFPLFAFFVAEGFHHTRNVRNYFLRLFVFAVTIEIGVFAYFLATGDNYLFKANIFWVLVFGLLSLVILKSGKWYLEIIIVAMLAVSELLAIGGYGAYGILLIIVFGCSRDISLRIMYFMIINLFFIDIPLWTLIGHEEFVKYPWEQWFSLLALVPIYMYNGTLGRTNKWFFYLYYPIHLAVIFIISC